MSMAIAIVKYTTGSFRSCQQNDAKGRVPQVRVAEDGPSVSFVRAISSRRSFDEKILRKITGKEYRESESSACVVARDDTALEMQAKNVHPLNGLWGERRQVVQLR